LTSYQPEYFVLESALGLFSAKGENGRLYFVIMLERFAERGYLIE